MTTELEYLNDVTDAFVRAIHDVLGADKGKEAIEALKPVLGKAWKDGIILRKLASDVPNGRRVRFKLTHGYSKPLPGDPYAGPDLGVPKKINAIKALRQITGMGLVDAKNAIEQSYNDWRYAELNKPVDPSDEEQVANNHRSIQSGMADLQNAGWQVFYA